MAWCILNFWILVKRLLSTFSKTKLSRVNQALHLKNVETTNTKFLLNNAQSYIAKIAQQRIEELTRKVPLHPPYSSGLASADDHLCWVWRYEYLCVCKVEIFLNRKICLTVNLKDFNIINLLCVRT